MTNGTGPPHLTQMFERRIPNRVLRSNTEVIHTQNRTATKFAERDFVYRAKEYWKKLPYEVQNKPTLATFKSALKREELFEHLR